MAGQDELSGLLLALYRASRELAIDRFQDAALEILKPQLKFDSAQWGSGSQNPEWISKRHVHLHNDRPDAAALYEEIKEQDDAVKLAWTRKRGAFSYNLAEMMTGKSRSGIRAYGKTVEHENILLTFDIDNAFTRWVSLYRADGARRFSGHDTKLAAALVPHLWEALAINRLTHLEHLGAVEAQRRFDLGICDREGRVHHCEAGFRALMRTEFGDHFAGRLPQQCIDALIGCRRFRGKSIVITVAQPADVLFLKARARGNIDRLSEREFQIACEVARGLSHKHIADALGIAPSTVRNHIQAIHDKLGVRNATELSVEIKRYT